MSPPLDPSAFRPPAALEEGLEAHEGTRFVAPDRARTAETSEERRVRAAVAHAYRAHQGLVYRLALRYGQGRTAFAEDVTQDVFLQLWRCAGALQELDALEGWLYTTTTRRCLNKLRNERLVGLLTFRWLRTDGEPSVDAHALHGARDELRRALEALSALPPKERVAFSMYHLDGKSQEEIGAVLGHSKGYVCKLIARAAESLTRLGWEVAT